MSSDVQKKLVEIFFKNEVFRGNAYLSDDLKSITIEDASDSPSLVGEALSLILANKDLLLGALPAGEATRLGISGWNIDGLDESNLGLLSHSSEVYQNYGKVALSLSSDLEDNKDIELHIGDEGELIIEQEGYFILIPDENMAEYNIEYGFDFDRFVECELVGFQNKEGLFEALGNFIKEDVISSEFKDKNLFTHATISLFDAARLGKEGLYRIAEESFAGEGINIEINEMTTTPIKIEGNEVLYRFKPIDFRRNGEHVDISNSTPKDGTASGTLPGGTPMDADWFARSYEINELIIGNRNDEDVMATIRAVLSLRGQPLSTYEDIKAALQTVNPYDLVGACRGRPDLADFKMVRQYQAFEDGDIKSLDEEFTPEGEGENIFNKDDVDPKVSTPGMHP